MVALAGVGGALSLVVGAWRQDHMTVHIGMTVLSLAIAVAIFRQWRKLL